MKTQIPNLIRTFSGRYLDVLNPSPESIDLIDIVHGLSHQCRFGGHTPIFYSVAQHSVLVCNAEIPAELKLQALMHDASEAYLGDLPTPIKRLLPRYTKIEDNLMRVIAQKFGFDWPMHPTVNTIDKLVLQWEWYSMFEKNYDHPDLKGLPKLKPIPADEARTLFLHNFNRLMEEVK